MVTATMADFFAGGGGSIPEPTYAGATARDANAAGDGDFIVAVWWGADRIRNELAGSDLACWCPLDQPCHAGVLLEIANRGEGA